jgi:histone deacetylase complex regulatory component SIN3
MATQQPPTPAPGQPQQQQGQPQQQGAGDRPLNVRDALSYLDQVKVSQGSEMGEDGGWRRWS